MKFNMKAVAASVLFAVAGTSQAAILNALPYPTQFDGELFISIVRDTAAPESMIIDTGLSLIALQSGTTTTWTSSASQTAAILNFLGTAPSTSFRFNAAGVTAQHEDLDQNNLDSFFTTLSSTIANPELPPGSELATPRGNIQTFTTEVNNAYNSLSSFNTVGIVTGLNPGEAGYHYNPTWGNIISGALTGYNTENVVGTEARLVNYLNTSTELFGFDLGYDVVGFLNIDATTGVASLGQGAPAVVPVPAAAWLLGSGLVGLVGVGRRRTA